LPHHENQAGVAKAPMLDAVSISASQEFVNAIRHSAHNEWLDKVRFADLRKWLLTLDLI
jgi:type II secretory pathway component PulM